MPTENTRDPRVYHPHRKDGLDRNLTRLNEADYLALKPALLAEQGS